MTKETLKEKKLYESADVELIRFNFADIIVTSPVSETGKDGPIDESNWDTWT